MSERGVDMPGSRREIDNNDCWEDGPRCPDPGTVVLRGEDDGEHEGRRPLEPGPVHPASEAYVAAHGDAPAPSENGNGAQRASQRRPEPEATSRWSSQLGVFIPFRPDWGQ